MHAYTHTHTHTHRRTCPHTRTCREAHPLPAGSRPFHRPWGANYITGNRSVSLTSPGASPVQGSRQNTRGRAAGQAQLQQMSAAAEGPPGVGPCAAGQGQGLARGSAQAFQPVLAPLPLRSLGSAPPGHGVWEAVFPRLYSGKKISTVTQ